MGDGYALAVDIGTSNTCAAVQREGSDPTPLRLGYAGTTMPSAVLVHGGRTAVGDVLWLVSLRLTGTPHDAADAMQEAMTSMWLHIDSFRGEASFGTWAHRIVVNAALVVIRRRRREIPSDGDDLRTAPTGMEMSEAVAVRDELRRAVTGLPEQFREALVLRAYGGMSYAEIADYQRVPVQTVRSRLHRARSAVMEVLARTAS